MAQNEKQFSFRVKEQKKLVAIVAFIAYWMDAQKMNTYFESNFFLYTFCTHGGGGGHGDSDKVTFSVAVVLYPFYPSSCIIFRPFPTNSTPFPLYYCLTFSLSPEQQTA